MKNPFKALIAVAAVAALAISLAACKTSAKKDSSGQSQPTSDGSSLQIVNPMLNFETREGLFADLGFTYIALPDAVSVQEINSIASTMGDLKTKYKDIEISARFALKTEQDLSGVYLSEETKSELDVGDITVAVRTAGDEVVAGWGDATYSYSISFTKTADTEVNAAIKFYVENLKGTEAV